MLKEKLGKVKEKLMKGEGKDQKKKIENLIVFLVILVVTILAINMIWKEDKSKTNSKENTNNTMNKQLADETQGSLSSVDTRKCHKSKAKFREYLK